jgi:hypothetical protein
MNIVVDTSELKTAELFPEQPVEPASKQHETIQTDNSEICLLGRQEAVSARLNEDGDLIITQDDAVVVVAADLIDLFVERLTDLLGYGSSVGRRS